MIEAAVSHLENAKEKDRKEFAEMYEDLTRHYSQRLASLEADEDDDGDGANHARHITLTLEALRVERETAIRLRDESRISDEVLRRIERELDLTESRIVALDNPSLPRN